MLINIMSALVIVFAAMGAVFLLMLFLQRLIRPDEGSYTLTVHLQADELQNEAKIGYAVQRIRFFGEENCTKVYVCCEGLASEEAQMLRNSFMMYDFVRFIGLEGEKTEETDFSCK